ncbi:MAG TPA: S9 family peptidase [Anaerolineae bacterium]|nr:S9 family peptidase [Anaerolineae bacterium]HQI85690.1 S9 family peptidase [Anaerolineae bacterium]
MPKATSIARYLNVRQAYAPTFSGDGRRLAFLTDITGAPQVWQVPLTSAPGTILWPEQLTFETDRVMLAQFSPVEDGRLLYTRDTGGNEKQQLFLLSEDGSPDINLTQGFEDVTHSFGAWEKDGSALYFSANRRNPALFDFYRQPLDGEALLVWQNDAPGFLSHVDISADGQRAIVVRSSSSFSHTLLEINLADGTARELLASAEPARFTAVHYGHDERALYLITDRDADFLYIARLNLDTGALERLIAPAWDCDALALAPDGRSLAYAVNVEGAHHIYLYDLATSATRPAPGIAERAGVVRGDQLVFSPDGCRITFAMTTATRAADIYVWDLGEDAVYPVTRSSHGGLPVEDFVAPTLIRYPTFDTLADGTPRTIPAWFFAPQNKSDQPAPAVVVVHGGPEGQFQPVFTFFIQYLVNNGYAVLAPNVRGSTGYGKAYSHLDDVEKRMDSVADLAHAAHWLREQPGIDGDRLVVYGGSYGGFMVLAALTAYPELWAAGVDVVGISNFVTFLENTSAYRRAHREAEYGSLARDRAFLESIAPMRHVDNIVAPLFIVHGANDPRVPLSEAEQLVAALQARGVPVEFLVFDDEGHGVVKLKNKLVMFPAIVEFLSNVLTIFSE